MAWRKKPVAIPPIDPVTEPDAISATAWQFLGIALAIIGATMAGLVAIIKKFMTPRVVVEVPEHVQDSIAQLAISMTVMSGNLTKVTEGMNENLKIQAVQMEVLRNIQSVQSAMMAEMNRR